MELKDRLRVILEEKHLKQKEFAATIKVTESYVSNLLNGKRGISDPIAYLIEEVYGYSAQWVLTGNGDKYISYSQNPALSPSKKSLIADLEQMSEDELIAVRAFMNSLKEIKKNIK